MDMTIILVLIALALVAGLFGIASRMDKRAQRKMPPAAKPGTAGIIVLWIKNLVLAGFFLAIVLAIAYRSIPFAGVAGSLIGVYLLFGLIYRLVRREEDIHRSSE